MGGIFSMERPFVLPDTILLSIFSYLEKEDFLQVAQVCKQWLCVSEDDSLWRALFLRRYSCDLLEMPMKPYVAPTWKEEFYRLQCESPRLDDRTIFHGHQDEILHVSYSHDGTKFVTTSKEPVMKVWELADVTEALFVYDFENFEWNDTKYSCFSPSDKLLLVCGSKYGYPIERGRVALFDVNEGFQLLQHFVIDSLAAWINDEAFVGGILHFDEDTFDSTTRLCAFVRNKECNLPQNNATRPERRKMFVECTLAHYQSRPSIFDCYVAVTGSTKDSECGAEDSLSGGGDSEGDRLRGEHSDDKSVCQLRESSPESHQCDHQSGMESVSAATIARLFRNRHLVCISGSQGDELYRLELTQKVNRTPAVIPSASDLEDTTAGFSYLRLADGSSFEVLSELKITQKKHCLLALITGICLASDGRYLFLNCRTWLKNSEGIPMPRDPSHDLEVRVFDMKTFEDTGIRYSGHRGFDTVGPCFVYLDVSKDFVCSGSTDQMAYLWERHYRCKIDTMSHNNGIVNSVAFNPVDQRRMVSVGDDHSVKLWHSWRHFYLFGSSE